MYLALESTPPLSSALSKVMQTLSSKSMTQFLSVKFASILIDASLSCYQKDIVYQENQVILVLLSHEFLMFDILIYP